MKATDEIQVRILNLKSLRDLISSSRKAEKIAAAELAKCLEAEASKILSERGKDYGAVSMQVGDTELVWQRSQSVSWDQEKLRALWEALPREMGDKLIKLEFSVAEATYNAQADPELFQALTNARTTSVAEPTIKLK